MHYRRDTAAVKVHWSCTDREHSLQRRCILNNKKAKLETRLINLLEQAVDFTQYSNGYEQVALIVPPKSRQLFMEFAKTRPVHWSWNHLDIRTEKLQ